MARADSSRALPGEYQSLYRRFRPQRFDEVVGQEHVGLALRNAVRQGTVAHAYLFSGPRGTGKTSTARILAKALNCAEPVDGEPCGRCQSCTDIARGASLDVHELDAASNNGVDAMRDLVARAALGTPGRWKVYIVDEVHMLTTAASNALLKTLEEPPGHVVFVLATTDSQKVLPTVRSRTQHYEFRLLGADALTGLVRSVRDAAQLDMGEDAVAAAVRKGRGSARDALSALDQLAAAGEVHDEVSVLDELGAALAEPDAGRALVAVAKAVADGREIHTLTSALVEHLRQGFLSMVAPDLMNVSEHDRARVEEMARRMGLPAVVRAMENLGHAQVDMRDAPDPRVTLEAALIRLAHPEADDSPSAILERLDRLERSIAGRPAPGAPASESAAGAAQADPAPTHEGPGAAPRTAARPDGAGASPTPVPGSSPAASAHSRMPDDASGATRGAGGGPGSAATEGERRGPDLARKTLGAIRRQTGGDRSGAAASSRSAPTEPSGSAGPPSPSGLTGDGSPSPPAGGTPGEAAGSGASPSRDELVEAWGDQLLFRLSNRARARFRVGRFLAVENGAAVFALPNETHRSYCEEVRTEVEQLLGEHFGRAVRLRLVVDDESELNAATRGGARATTVAADLPEGRGGEAAAGVDAVTEADLSAGGDLSSGPEAGGVEAKAARRPRTTAPAEAPARRPPAPGSGTRRNSEGGRETGIDTEQEHSALLDPVVLATETEPAGAGPSPEQRVKQLFPGAEEV